MEKFFGTDGVRSRAGHPPMDAETIVRLGKAWGVWLLSQDEQKEGAPCVIIGKDTRESGDMLAAALASGIMQAGVDVVDAGVLPTPAVALMVRDHKAAGGAVISASHNPFWDNGVKFFNHEGFKLTDSEEASIEGILRSAEIFVQGSIGRMRASEDGLSSYVRFIVERAGEGESLSGLRLVLDTAHGAMYQAAPEALRRLGAEVEVMAADPDGRNINDGVGSQHTEALARQVRLTGAHAGMAFDGDGDRLIAVDASGNVLRGDLLLAIFALEAKKGGRLNPPVLVSTVMSNLGLTEALRSAGISHEITAVGDRKVLERMREKGGRIGGEDSGHMIFLDPHCTGDGLFAAVRLARLCRKTPLEELALCMKTYPQVLINVPVREKPPLEELREVQESILASENILDGKGRILVRYSGTESLCRIMVEAASEEKALRACAPIQAALLAAIGGVL